MGTGFFQWGIDQLQMQSLHKVQIVYATTAGDYSVALVQQWLVHRAAIFLWILKHGCRWR